MVYAVILAMVGFIVTRLIMFIINRKNVKNINEIDSLIITLINGQRS
jgi:hypothetical protein